MTACPLAETGDRRSLEEGDGLGRGGRGGRREGGGEVVTTFVLTIFLKLDLWRRTGAEQCGDLANVSSFEFVLCFSINIFTWTALSLLIWLD